MNDTLVKQYQGVDGLSEMGTTGLIAWVLAGDSGHRWTRYEAASRVIRSRKQSQKLFARGIISTGTQHKIDLKRFQAAMARRGYLDVAV